MDMITTPRLWLRRRDGNDGESKNKITAETTLVLDPGRN
jgi:hypothetical protein